MNAAFVRRPSAKLVVTTALVGCGLVGGLAVGRVDAVALGAGFAVVLVAGLVLTDTPEVAVDVAIDPLRLDEGQTLAMRIRFQAPATHERLELALVVPPGIEVVDGDRLGVVDLPPGAQVDRQLVLRPVRWGAYRLGAVALRRTDRTGLYRHEAVVDLSRPVRVHPRATTVDRLARPSHTRVHTGNQLARAKAHGNEFADVRPFAAGDRVRDVNWRLTARRSELWVNERHPERNADVVLFLDAFTASALDPSVRVAAVLADRYLAQRDRVGMVRFGGSLRWIEPGSGRRQRYRLIDTLLDTTVVATDADRRLRTVPARFLPPRALVVAVSALDDERSVLALEVLASQGTDLIILEVAPELSDGGGAGDGGGGDASEALAVRLWRAQRSAVRSHLRRRGIPVVEVSSEQRLDVAMQEVIAFRRRTTRRTG